MDWQALQDGLKTLTAAFSGMNPLNLAWDGEPEMMRGYPMAMLELTQQARDRSTDEVRFELDDDGALVPVVVGNRVVTLTITVKSRNQRGPYKATAILEKMRTRLELPLAQQMLDDLEIVLRDSTPSVDQSAVIQQREESIAALSLTLGYTVEERDAEHPEDPVEHVQLSGDVVADGETIATPGANADALTFDEDNELLTIG